MFTVFMIDGVSNHIYFVNSDHFEQWLKNMDIDIRDVKSQEVSLGPFIRLKERDYRVFILCLAKGSSYGKVERKNEGLGRG